MTVFDDAYAAETCWLEMDTGDVECLRSHRWAGKPDRADEAMLARCRGAALDVGCGPGRLTCALRVRGLAALGVDASAAAVRLTHERGGAAVHGSVFGRLPGEGAWGHVLLADGNLGIGGDPVALLGRAAELLSPAGTAIVELHPPGLGLRVGEARLGGGPWFPWARVGTDAIGDVAGAAGLRPVWTATVDGRWLAELGRAAGTPPRQESGVAARAAGLRS
jgi:SAM-dependent methyltransferase